MKKILTKKFSLSQCKLFSKKSGDMNAIHLDRNINIVSQFQKPVVQGLLIIDFFFNKNFMKKILKKSTSLNIVFKKPVFINEKIDFFIINRKYEVVVIVSNSFQEKIYINIELKDKKNFLFSKTNTLEKFLSIFPKISKKVGNFKKNLNLISTININKKSTKKNGNKILSFSNNFYKYIYLNRYLEINTFFLSFEKKFKEPFQFSSNLQINKEKFRNKKILIIGGSSGLGRILTIFFLKNKINFNFTFNKNLGSVKKIQRKYKVSKKSFFHLNEKKILSKKIDLINYDLIYFFPTPKIFNYSEKYFDYKVFNNFNSINIKFMLDIINYFSQSSKKFIFYVPSTKLISNFEDNIEYNTSKIIQEKILQKIQKTFKNIKIINPRLDSFLTRSTKGLLNNKIGYDNFLKSAIDL